MKIKQAVCAVIGHNWGAWIGLDANQGVRQCLRCLLLDRDAMAFFEDDD